MFVPYYNLYYASTQVWTEHKVSRSHLLRQRVHSCFQCLKMLQLQSQRHVQERIPDSVLCSLIHVDHSRSPSTDVGRLHGSNNLFSLLIIMCVYDSLVAYKQVWIICCFYITTNTQEKMHIENNNRVLVYNTVQIVLT